MINKLLISKLHVARMCPGTPSSSTTNTGRHDIAEILLKVTLSTKKSNPKYTFYT
jgi:hypothetical protein